MSSHLSELEIQGYRERSLPWEKLVTASDHLAACEECHDRFNSSDRLGQVYAFLRADLEAAQHESHLWYEQLEGYVDGVLDRDQVRTVETHLAECGECETSVRELMGIKRISTAKAQRTPREAGEMARSAREFMPGGARFERALPGMRAGHLLRAAAVIIVVGSLVWVYLLRSRIGALDARLNQAERANIELSEEASGAGEMRDEVARLRQENERLRQGGVGNPDLAVSIRDGDSQVTLDREGNIGGLAGVAPDLAELVKNALTTGRIDVPPRPAVSIGRVSGPLRGPEQKETFRLLSPVGVVVESERPSFKWEAFPGATIYIVFIKDVHSSLEVESGPLSATEWTPEKPLPRGHTFAWMVEGTRGEQHIRAPALNKPFAAFKVLDKIQADEIREAATSQSGHHLLLGLLYARAGLREKALIELRALARENPGSPAVKNLMASLQSPRPLP
jgi:predicted anti-sigma-YlaC factor YlaD